jgi:hypothetical protein
VRKIVTVVFADVRGRYDEAAEFVTRSREARAPDDFASHAPWRAVHAKLLARAGRLHEADAVAREAVDLCATSDT